MTVWPTWLGLLAGLAALAAGLLAGSILREGWQLAARYTPERPFCLPRHFVASSILRLYRRPWAKALLRDRRCGASASRVASFSTSWPYSLTTG